jgi:electron-transferring-flavoprotein dehydrogenase
MDEHTYGGGFLYHMADNQVTLGFVTGLDYINPGSAPSRRCSAGRRTRRSAHIEGGKRIGYGARAITAGGLLSLPKLVFPARLVGCDAGT